ncbi:peptidoglycan-binding domain-containing protein [Cryobacterium sp. Sr3]|uniref:peptidoglycan-binding domain-containing protein n=1 Tax=Cryobacterium sp. Sr3 TaxID=1259194 RepID=UPI00141B1CE1|nr:peptidoglycan-binding domain-containing protein [Cryobacterium sp. Sr3]
MALQPLSTPPDLRAGVAPSSAPIALEPFLDARKVTIELKVQPAPDISIPATGVITQISCSKGGRLDSGSAPIEISGQRILALHLSTPMWRDFDYGTRGPDVAALQEELTRIGYDSGTSGRWDKSTSDAVNRLEQAMGIDGGDGGLPMTRVMWLPTIQVAVAGCPATLGSQVQAGSAFAAVPDVVISGRVDLPSDMTPGARIITVGSTTATLDSSGTIADVDGLASIAATPEASAVIASLNGPAQTSLSAELRLAAPISAANVPGGAIRTTGEVKCVFDANSSAAVPIAVLASSLGNATITFSAADIPKAVQTFPKSQRPCS